MSNNILQPIPQTLNNYLLQNGETVLSNTTPAALDGTSNVTWQLDQFGNISACVAASSAGGSVGTAGQIQMVGDTAGSFAASNLTDNGTSVSLGGLLLTTGLNNNLILGSLNLNPAYNVLSLNGTNGNSGIMGLIGGVAASGDQNLYISSTVDIVFTPGLQWFDPSPLIVSSTAITPAVPIVSTSTATPIQLTAGTLAVTPIHGGFEYDGTHLYFTTSTGTRQIVTLV